MAPTTLSTGAAASAPTLFGGNREFSSPMDCKRANNNKDCNKTIRGTWTF